MENEKIREILASMKSIAIIGLSPDESKDSNKVAKYLIEKGYEIYPIYPKEDEILGRKVYRNLTDIKANIDVVVMFRKAEFADVLFADVVKQGAKTLWLQLGIENDEVKCKAEKIGIKFVQNRCIMQDLKFL